MPAAPIQASLHGQYAFSELSVCRFDFNAEITELQKGIMSKTIDDLIAAEKYPHNKIFNLDPKSRLPNEKRNSVRREIEPTIASVRTQLNEQSKRIIKQFDSDRTLFKMKFPADELDFQTAGYADLGDELAEVFIQTIDLQDLIELGAPVPFILSRLTNILENLRFTIAEIGESLKKLEWHELEKSAISQRNLRMQIGTGNRAKPGQRKSE